MWNGSTDPAPWRGPARRALASLLLWAPALLLAAGAAADPRISLVEQQVERLHADALRAVERALAEDPEEARRLGFDYLRGHLLLLLGRRGEALQAFATSMGATPELEAYSRYRLAREQEDLDHPEVAAGLVATLVGSNAPRALVGPAVRLLERTLARGGDCRLLTGLDRRRFSRPDRRRLTLAVAGCADRGGDRPAAERRLLELLEESRADDVALAAAQTLDAWLPRETDTRKHLLVGLAFYRHREFSTAIQHLARAQVRLTGAADVSPREAFDCRYALARSHFWQERYGVAAAAFGALIKTVADPTRRAQLAYQRGRSLELGGDWEHAVAAFDQAYLLDPAGRWTDGALLGSLRLRWLSDHPDEAQTAIERLMARREYAAAARGLLFLASSELVSTQKGAEDSSPRRGADDLSPRGGADDLSPRRGADDLSPRRGADDLTGRAERVDGWLNRASQLSQTPPQELAYWRGRLEETRHQPVRAVAHYLDAVQRDVYHPFGKAALARLRGEALGPVARAVAARLAGSEDVAELYAAWLLLGVDHPQGARARHRLEQRLWQDPAVIPYLRLSREPTADWPLWQASLKRPEEMLLALGIFEEGASAMLRYFPVAEPQLAFTGSAVLAQSGEIKSAIYIAEIMRKRIPPGVPAQMLPVAYRRLLFPFGYSYLILRESERQGSDPHLLAAIIREESRWDPGAFSSASARGLTQFVLPTARRIGREIGLGELAPGDLEKPDISIRLGAAYLAELSRELSGSVPEVVAAYNAGEPQAALWRRYCLSAEPEEYLTKVAFRETRDYLTKVLTSREHYLELYAPASVTVGDGDRPAPRDPGR